MRGEEGSGEPWSCSASLPTHTAAPTPHPTHRTSRLSSNNHAHVIGTQAQGNHVCTKLFFFFSFSFDLLFGAGA